MCAMRRMAVDVPATALLSEHNTVVSVRSGRSSWSFTSPMLNDNKHGGVGDV